MPTFTSNLSADERERLAYLAGDTMLAELLHERDQLQTRLNGLEDHGVYDEADVLALQSTENDLRKNLKKAESRQVDLKEALGVVVEALLDPELRLTKAKRADLADALESVLIGAGYSGSAKCHVRAALGWSVYG